jgi:hypothetical protein
MELARYPDNAVGVAGRPAAVMMNASTSAS